MSPHRQNMAPGADYGARRLEIRGEMVRTCSPRLAEKRTEGAHKRLSRALLSNLQPVFPCGLMPVKHEMPSVSPPEFTTLTHNNLLVARFFRWPMVMLLMIEGNCSCFASKPAHISGHLPEGRTRAVAEQRALLCQTVPHHRLLRTYRR